MRSKAGKEFWKLLSLLVAVSAAVILTPSVYKSLTFLQDEVVQRAIAFLIVFIVVHQGVQILTSVLKLNFSLPGLDPVLGGVFSTLEAMLFAGLIGYIAMAVPALRITVEQTFILYRLSEIARSFVAMFGGGV